MARGSVTVCGETVTDLVPQPGGDYRALPGGSPANVAVALARLGEPVALLARLGADVFGRQMRDHLVTNNVDPRLLVAAREMSTLAVVSFDDHRRAHYDFWAEGSADWQWSAADLAGQPEVGCVAFHTGSLASWTPPGDRVLHDLLGRVRAANACTISYDPNVRPALIGDAGAARAAVEPTVRLAHVVKASEEDLEWLYPGLDPVAVAREWAALGPGLVVVTLGPAGALAVRPGVDTVVRRAAPAVDVVDTVGAGDAFTAGLLHGLAEVDGLGPEPLRRLADLTDDRIGRLLTGAALAAALTCTRAGCDPPTAAELVEPG